MKYLSKTNVKFIFLLMMSVVVASCDNKDSVTPNSQFSEIADIAIFHGNLESDTVIVNTQGGPEMYLDDRTLKEIISHTETQHILYANVHQVQTQNPNQFASSDITFEQAKAYNMQSVANLKKVVEYFKEKGKTVYILGISFGAFVTQELIALHGMDIADAYLIAVGRLDIDEATWQPFSEGKFTEYIYDESGNYTVNVSNEDFEVVDRNMARLAAGLGFNRYTTRLANISDLSKIIYVYGDRDEQVGPLSSSEIQFLENKGAQVVLQPNGNHDDAAGLALGILKEYFQ